MRLRAAGFLATAAAVAFVSAPGTASACHACHKNPCVLVVPTAAPAYQCVTEMVPQTVYKTRTRMTYQPVTETIMARVAETTFVERQRVVCKPVWDTTYVQRTSVVCRPVSETTMVNQSFTVCRPVTTTRQVTEYQMQATTQVVTVPVATQKCGHCGKVKPACGCAVVAQTCYAPVPVTRNVNVTQMVPEVQTRQIPVTHTRLVSETKVENVPIRNCRIVQEVVTDRIPIVNYRCVPKQVTRQVPVPVCETVAETCYRPVTRMVAVAPAPAPMPYAPAPSQQGPTATPQG